MMSEFSARIQKFRNVDAFAIVNLTLFFLMCFMVYYDRFVEYRGYANIEEFYIYACVILGVILVFWIYLRNYQWSSWILILLQFGIIAHFAGAFVPLEKGRLYDAVILGARYDKYVHAFNAFAAAALISHLFDMVKAHVPIRPLVTVALVLGLGSIVEIIEYLVMLTVANAGVGGYDNNMQDLIANLFGGCAFAGLSRLLPRVKRLNGDFA